MASLFKPHVEIIFEVTTQIFLSADDADILKSVPRDVRPGDFAYAIFTSGTTGEPKGVLIEHRGVCTSKRSINELLKCNGLSRVMQLSSHAFDFSILEMLSVLINGATLCIPAEEEMGDIGTFIVREKITTVMVTPSFSRVLDQTCLRGLDCLMLGGEAVTTEDVVDRINQVKQLVSIYGPSEASCCTAIVHLDSGKFAASNIARPTGCFHWVVNPGDHSSLSQPPLIPQYPCFRPPRLIHRFSTPPTKLLII